MGCILLDFHGNDEKPVKLLDSFNVNYFIMCALISHEIMRCNDAHTSDFPASSLGIVDRKRNMSATDLQFRDNQKVC